jgi:hypothetical protein
MAGLQARDPSLQWAVDKLIAEFGHECVVLYPSGDDGEVIGVKLPDGVSFGRFLRVPDGVRCDPGYERMSEPRLQALIEKVYHYLRTGEPPRLGDA